MTEDPTDEELIWLEILAGEDPEALRAFDDYMAALSVLEEVEDVQGIDLRDFRGEASDCRCELLYQLERKRHPSG